MKIRKIVYVAHPLGSGADREANRREAAKWVALVGELGYAPIADWIILSGQWSEERREEGLEIDFTLITACDEVWLVGPRVSPGMRFEAKWAFENDIPVFDLIGHNHSFVRASVATKTLRRCLPIDLELPSEL